MLVSTNPGSNLKPMIEYTNIMDCFGITSLGLYLYKPLCIYFTKPWVFKSQPSFKQPKPEGYFDYFLTLYSGKMPDTMTKVISIFQHL